MEMESDFYFIQFIQYLHEEFLIAQIQFSIREMLHLYMAFWPALLKDLLKFNINLVKIKVVVFYASFSESFYLEF